MARVRFPNGYEAEMRETLALRMVDKGQCVLITKPEKKEPAKSKAKSKAEEPGDAQG